MSLGSCRTPEVITEEVLATADCKDGENCYSVSLAFMIEHGQLMADKKRLKDALRVCQEK